MLGDEDKQFNCFMMGAFATLALFMVVIMIMVVIGT